MSAWIAGAELPAQVYRVTRADLRAYAAASGDSNPIHLDEAVAASVGLPGVIAHGMYTLALAARAAETWAGAPGGIRELVAKFSKPVVVPDGSQGTEVVVAGTVSEVLPEGAVKVALTVTCGADKVLAAAWVVIGG